MHYSDWESNSNDQIYRIKNIVLGWWGGKARKKYHRFDVFLTAVIGKLPCNLPESYSKLDQMIMDVVEELLKD